MKKNIQKDKLQAEALNALKINKYNGIVILPTGVGKSWILIQVLKILNPKKILYLADSTMNRDVTFKNELIKWGCEELIDKIEFLCYQSAYKRENFKYDLVLGDEFDMSCTPEYSKSFLNNKFKHKVLVSATLDDDKRKLAKKIAPIVFEVGLKDIEGDGVLNTTNYYIVKYMLTKQENFAYLKYNAQFAFELNKPKPNKWKIEQLVMQRNLFLNKLESSLRTCKSLLKDLYANKDRKILIFSGVSAQADAVCKYSYHSKTDEKNFIDFDNGKIRILSVVGKVDRGANIDGVNTIVFEAPFKSKTKQQQKGGRGRRLDVDDVLEIYFLIPYYRDRYGKLKPTVVEKWVYESVGDIDFKPKIYHIKQ